MSIDNVKASHNMTLCSEYSLDFSLWHLSETVSILLPMPISQFEEKNYLVEWDGQSIYSRIWLLKQKFCSQSACNWELWGLVSLEVIFEASVPY